MDQYTIRNWKTERKIEGLQSLDHLLMLKFHNAFVISYSATSIIITISLQAKERLSSRFHAPFLENKQNPPV